MLPTADQMKAMELQNQALKLHQEYLKLMRQAAQLDRADTIHQMTNFTGVSRFMAETLLDEPERNF